MDQLTVEKEKIRYHLSPRLIPKYPQQKHRQRANHLHLTKLIRKEIRTAQKDWKTF